MGSSKNCIVRLSRYRNVLYRLQSMGFVGVFSNNLADATGVTSLQVRKDFSMCKIMGNKKGGYKVDDLLESLDKILGKNEIQKVILAGLGKIGTALLNYKGFEKEGIKIVAAFDIDPSKYNTKQGTKILPLGDLKDFVRENNIKTGIISVPDIAAQQVLDLMLKAGIKGILNFAPIRLKCPKAIDVLINNVDLVLEMEKLIYFVNTLEESETKNV